VSVDEPFGALFSQGMIQRKGAVMAKSKGNGVAPDDMVARYGADTARVYELFIGPPELDAEWNDRGVDGVARFLNRAWRLVVGEEEAPASGEGQLTGADLRRKLHETIDKVTRDIDAFRFNTAVSALMELTNLMQDYIQGGGARDEAWDAVCRDLARLLAPFAPHLAEELWERLGGAPLCALASWPVVDQSELRRSTVTVVVQVDGRLRDRIEIPAGAGEADALALARRSANVERVLEGRPVTRTIFVADRLINLVTR
jgi:leucyl-tRNA synthetase